MAATPPEVPPEAPGNGEAPPRRRHRSIQFVGLGVGVLFLGALVLVVPWGLRAQAPSPNDPVANADSARAASADPTAAATKPGVDRASVLRLVLQANPMLWPLGACSIITLGYVLERFLALRRERVIPREFADRLLERLSSGKLDRERSGGAPPVTRSARG